MRPAVRALRGGTAAMMVLPLLVATRAAAAAPAPLDLSPDQLEPLLVQHARDFFPDERATAAPAVLAPRLGLPAVATPDRSLQVQLLEWAGAPPYTLRLAPHRPGGASASTLLSAGCDLAGSVPVATVSRQVLRQVPVPGSAARVQSVHLEVRPAAPLAPGSHDLLVCTAGAALRHPRAVWIRPTLPGAPGGRERLHVVHLSDLHAGHRDSGALAALVDRVNRRAPDLVVVTGDVVEQGHDAAQWKQARELLLRVEAPLLVILGNHDHGLSPRALLTRLDLRGWAAFARHFHPQLYFTVPVGGWDFVGFDSGASILSARILTRGLSPASLDRLRAQLERSSAQGRGVVLLSHAPTRARLLTGSALAARGLTGRMDRGALALEQALLEAVARGQTVLHLAGHTHFADAFVARHTRAGGWRFERSSRADAVASLTLPRQPGLAALLTAQSATKSGIRLRRSGAGRGFTEVRLGPSVKVSFVRWPAG